MNLIKKIKKSEEGFTLVELVIVIAILAVLAALLVPRIMGNMEEAKRSREMSDARTIASEITTYNAMEKAKGNTDNLITGEEGVELKGELEGIDRTIPNWEYVKIVIKSDGLAEVVWKKGANEGETIDKPYDKPYDE